MNSPKELTLHFHSVSPLFIADAGAGEAHLDSNGNIRFGKSVGSAQPVSRIERKPVLIAKEIANDEDDSVWYFPYVKANNIVGRLRRFAQDVVNEVVLDKGEQISGATYRGMSCGATSGTPTGVVPSLSEHRQARQHFYLGLFGGGSGMFASGMSMSDLNVKHRALVGAGVLPAGLGGVIDVPVSKLTYPISLIRRDRMLELSDFNIERVVQGGSETLDEWRELVAQARLDKNAEVTEGKKKREALQNLVAYEAALAGLGYYGKIVMNPQTTDAQLGLLLEALTRFAKNNAMGGKTAKGFGRFNLIVKEGDEVLLRSQDGEIMESAGEKYQEALLDELDKLDIQQLESFFA